MQRNTLADQVYEIVRIQIEDGQIMPGQGLNVASLAQELSVSETPVREALNRLAKAGLVESVPYRGFVACRVTVRDATEIYTLRVAIEGLGASLAAENADAEAIADIESILGRFEEETERHGLTTRRRDLEHEFHLSVAKASGNDTLVELLQILLVRSWLFWHAWQGPRPLVPDSRAGQQRKQILESLKARDPDSARRVMRQHLEAPLYQLLQLAPEDREAEAMGMLEEVMDHD